MEDELTEYHFGRCLWAQQASEDERPSDYCEACECEVTDIRGWSKDEFDQRYKEGEGRLCVRSSADQFVSRGEWLKFAAGLAVGLLPLVSGCDSIGNVASTSASLEPETSVETQPDDVWIGVVVENQPELIGGFQGLQDRVQYPRSAREAGIEGRVFVQFIVTEQGGTDEIAITRSLCEACDEEAIRVIRETKFSPAKQRGKPVEVLMVLPIYFQLPDNADT